MAALSPSAFTQSDNSYYSVARGGLKLHRACRVSKPPILGEQGENVLAAGGTI